MKDLINFLMTVGLYVIFVIVIGFLSYIFNIEPTDVMEAIGIFSLVGWSFILSNSIIKRFLK